MMFYGQKGGMVPAARPSHFQAGPPAKRARTAPAENTATGEVRFADANATHQAVSLSGTMINGHIIEVELDARSKDGTKIVVRGLPEAYDWNELKAHFGQCGAVRFADVKKAGSTPVTGEVRFDTADQAMAAMELNGTDVGGYQIAIRAHAGSKDKTKLQVFNIPPHMEWQELKDFFVQAGLTPAFCDVASAGGGGGGNTAEVRYDDAVSAQTAVNTLNGSMLGGAIITVSLDTRSQDRTKLDVGNVPAGIEWQELKDHFKQCGTVAFVQTGDKSAKGGGKGAGGGKGQTANMQQMQNQMMMMMQMMGGKGQGFGGGGYGGGGYGAGQMMGFGGKGGSLTGEVRYESPMSAQMAAMTLSSMPFKGAQISVGVDNSSKDASKVWVSGVPAGTTWQELKEHMAWCGPVAFCNCK